MGKKNRQAASSKPVQADKPATLKDLLDPGILEKLKAQADQMKAEEAKQREAAQEKAAEERKAEQKRLDNNFGHLLENSKLDWRKYK
ncbi:YqkE family protein [Paenibacillus lutrae]|uniref:DUF3886 domain-containing protein n=1 Tax=Paenibacillus lutrae TaxID=2078573 RepID=A0A7X3FK68_9BACL|nr:YqkE family protein [Paenibacillus lutrae]MVP01122.1 DUF3886 domain-containing protein [Paenibacillus lutrae]